MFELQQYEKYTTEDHKVWQILYKRQLQTIEKVAYKQFITGTDQLAFSENKIPDFIDINKELKELTGWQIYAVPGLIANDVFFEKMYNKEFGTTTWIRKMEELDYLEEPDMFHDVFGHIPLLTDKFIGEYLHQLAKLAVAHIHNEEVIEAIARLYWYTIEFGLVKENGEIKIYGAGILSSIGETNYSLSNKATHVPFSWQQIIDTPYIKDSFQEKYFVLNSFEQLTDAVKEFGNHLQHKYQLI
jgi:phenylalanine-4-hydroxylase